MPRRVGATSCLRLRARLGKAVKNLLCTSVKDLAATSLQLLDRLPALCVRHANLERQALVKYDLPHEHRDRIGGADADFCQYPSRLCLELRLDSRRYIGGLAHF